MRDIIFRAISVETNRFIYGNLCISKAAPPSHAKVYYICPQVYDGKAQAVLKDTIGQYTGFVDVHGSKIYEKDIVSINGQGNCVITDIRRDFDLLAEAINEGDLNEIVGNTIENPGLIQLF
jgi:hypothetical protein